MDPDERSSTFGAIYLVDGARPAILVTPTFGLFLRAVMDDAGVLYP